MNDDPPAWKSVRLVDAAEVRLGRQRSPDRATGDHMRPYMRAANVGWDGLRLDDVKEMDFTPSEFETYGLRLGDVLVGEASGSRDEVGKSVVWRDEVPGACFQNTLIRVRADASRLLPEYLQLHLTHDARRGALAEVAKGIGIHHLGREGLANWSILLPPVDEQRRVVSTLTGLRARSRRAKDALDAVPALLDRLRQSILAAAFRGDLTADWREQNPDVEPASELLKRIRLERRKHWEKGDVPGGARGKYAPGSAAPEEPELPATWAVATWSEVGFCQNGRAYPSAEYRDEGVRLLRPGNLGVSGELIWSEQNTRYMDESWADAHPGHVVSRGEIVMNLTAQSLKDEFLGRVCLTGSDERCLLNQRLARLTPVGLDPRFAFLVFKSPRFRAFVDGLNTGSLIQHMFTSQVEEFVFPIPPLAEQQAIVRAVDGMVRALGTTRAAAADAEHQLAALDAGMLAAAFRGELLDRSADE